MTLAEELSRDDLSWSYPIRARARARVLLCAYALCARAAARVRARAGTTRITVLGNATLSRILVELF